MSVNKVILVGRLGKDPEALRNRLMSKIEICQKTNCWNWTGALSRGYGVMSSSFGASPYKAHRVSYELHIGNIQEGQVVRHTCDNRKCCNPMHLITGTQKDNVHDAVNRGRLNPLSLLNLRPGQKGMLGAGTKSRKEIESHVSQ